MIERLIKLVVCHLIFLLNTAIACDKPMSVTIPDGNSAIPRQMVAVQDEIRNYVAEMGEYLECVATEKKRSQRDIANLTSELRQLRQDQLDEEYNAAIDEMEQVVLLHNREAKKFRERDRT